MKTVIFKTENAVFEFSRNHVIEHLNALFKENSSDEINNLSELIKHSNEETILIPEEHIYIVLDLIAAGKGSITCNVCGKSYRADELESVTVGYGKSPFELNLKKKGGIAMLNVCTLTGNLGADPEVFYSSEGEPIATFNLAFKSSKKKTCWIKVTCFKRLSEITEKHLHKGARIAVVGTVDVNKWETDEGVQRSSFQLIANSIEFIKTDGRGFSEGQDNDDIPI